MLFFLLSIAKLERRKKTKKTSLESSSSKIALPDTTEEEESDVDLESKYRGKAKLGQRKKMKKTPLESNSSKIALPDSEEESGVDSLESKYCGEERSVIVLGFINLYFWFTSSFKSILYTVYNFVSF